MSPFSRLLASETLKLRRSQVGKLIWILPLLFFAMEGLFFELPMLRAKHLTPELLEALSNLQLRVLVTLWAGFFQPLLLALLPPLLFRPEHRFKTWRHLFSMPVPRRDFFLAKAVIAAVMSGFMLGLLGGLLLLERTFLGLLDPHFAIPFHGLKISSLLAWLWLGSLPLLAFYLWISDRINSLAVPVVFGLVGILLTIALTGQELPQPWRRDLIPWILPYAAAERVIHTGVAQQEVHEGAKPFQAEKGILRLPSGRKYHVWQSCTEEEAFPPPPPTPRWLLASYSCLAGLLFLLLGWWDAGRQRV